MNKKLDRKKQKQVHRYVRAIIQLIFFLLVPSAFTAAFSGVKYLFTQIGKGDAIGMTSFVTALCVLCLYTILFGRFFCICERFVSHSSQEYLLLFELPFPDLEIYIL